MLDRLFTTQPPRTAARLGTAIAVAVIVWLLLTQLFEIYHIRNGLSPTADPYSEANVIRAAEHYAKYGFLVDAGLAHIVYGDRFRNSGWTQDLYRFPLPSGVYTRYPPLPEIIAGMLEKIVGYRIWVWRLVPVLLGLAATVYAFAALRRVLDSLAASGMIILLSIVPMVTSHMHGLHFEGYGHAAFLCELALLVRILFLDERPSRGAYMALFGLGFLQGWLSFEYVFVVSAAVVPLALVARAHGARVELRTVLLLLAVSGGGFVAAHLLHFLQVATFYGSISTALQDFSGRAMYRFAGEAQAPYLVQVAVNLVKYAVVIWFSPNNQHFGALLFIVTLLVILREMMSARGASGLRTGTRRGLAMLSDKRVVLPMVVSYAIAAIWLFVMPSHANIHTHIVPRVFFLPYFVVVLIFTLSVFQRTVDKPLHG
jgi:hypothetical protein